MDPLLTLGFDISDLVGLLCRCSLIYGDRGGKERDLTSPYTIHFALVLLDWLPSLFAFAGAL